MEALVERNSFAGGQIGRALRFRSDLGRYQIAVEKQQNYISMVEGGATRSPGTRFVLPLKDQSQKGKLVPFRLTSDDYYMLLINGGKARFMRDGGFLQNPDTTPYEIAVPFAEADLAKLRTQSTGNLIYAVDGTRFVKFTRSGLTSWTVDNVATVGGPVDTQNLDTGITVQASAATGTGIALTGVGNPFTAAQVNQPFRLDDRDLSLTPEWTALETGIAANAQRRWQGNVYQNMSGGAVSAGPNAPVHTEGDVSAGSGYLTWRFLHPGYGFVRIKIFISANSVAADVLTRLPDTVVSGATYRWYPPAWDTTKGFPTEIAFASPKLGLYRADQFWQSVDSQPEDFTQTGQDDDAISGRLRSPDGSLVQIAWARAAGPLIVGTADIEWVFRGANLFDPITIKNLKPVPDNNDGSLPQIPALVDGGVMYVGKSGKRLHYGTIDAQKQGSQRLDSEEVSVSARDILAAGVVAKAWQRDPHRVLWMVMGDGSLVALTFMPKQQVIAFHLHPRNNAFFEDVAVIPAVTGGVDEVYFIVKRTINGATVRYAEQLGAFFTPIDPANPTSQGAWFLDCALEYDGAPVSTISNLIHLEGQTVGVMADGAMQKQKTVAGGAITLDRAASKILIGIPVTAVLRDLPRDLKAQDGSTKGKDARIPEGMFDFDYTGGGMVRMVGRDYQGREVFNESEAVLETGRKKYGAGIALYSGTKRIPIDGEFSGQVQLEIVNDDAMPCTVLGMSPRTDVEEET